MNLTRRKLFAGLVGTVLAALLPKGKLGSRSRGPMGLPPLRPFWPMSKPDIRIKATDFATWRLAGIEAHLRQMRCEMAAGMAAEIDAEFLHGNGARPIGILSQ